MNSAVSREVAKIAEGIVKVVQCAICLDTLKSPVSIGCGHFFCKDCTKKVLHSNYRAPCPLCKRSFTRRCLQDATQRELAIVAALKVANICNNLAGNNLLGKEKLLEEGEKVIMDQSNSPEKEIEPKVYKKSKLLVNEVDKALQIKDNKESEMSEHPSRSDDIKSPEKTEVTSKIIGDSDDSGDSLPDIEIYLEKMKKASQEKSSASTESITKNQVKESTTVEVEPASEEIAAKEDENNPCIVKTTGCIFDYKGKEADSVATQDAEDDPYQFKPNPNDPVPKKRGRRGRQKVSTHNQAPIWKKNALRNKTNRDDPKLYEDTDFFVVKNNCYQPVVNLEATEGEEKGETKENVQTIVNSGESVAVDDSTISPKSSQSPKKRKGKKRKGNPNSKTSRFRVSYSSTEEEELNSKIMEAENHELVIEPVQANKLACYSLTETSLSAIEADASVTTESDDASNKRTKHDYHQSTDSTLSVQSATSPESHEKDGFSLTKSPGWSRMKHLNKEFQLKQISTLEIQKTAGQLETPNYTVDANKVMEQANIETVHESICDEHNYSSNINKATDQIKDAETGQENICDEHNYSSNIKKISVESEQEKICSEHSYSSQPPSDDIQTMSNCSVIENNVPLPKSVLSDANTTSMKTYMEETLNCSHVGNNTYISKNILQSVDSVSCNKGDSVSHSETAVLLQQDKHGGIAYDNAKNSKQEKYTLIKFSVDDSSSDKMVEIGVNVKRKTDHIASSAKFENMQQPNMIVAENKIGNMNFLNQSVETCGNNFNQELSEAKNYGQTSLVSSYGMQVSNINPDSVYIGEEKAQLIEHSQQTSQTFFNYSAHENTAKYFRPFERGSISSNLNVNYKPNDIYNPRGSNQQLGQTAERTKVVKRTCFTFDEIQDYFGKSTQSGQLEMMYDNPFLGGDFKLQISIFDETLNVSVLRVLKEDGSDSAYASTIHMYPTEKNIQMLVNQNVSSFPQTSTAEYESASDHTSMEIPLQCDEERLSGFNCLVDNVLPKTQPVASFHDYAMTKTQEMDESNFPNFCTPERQNVTALCSSHCEAMETSEVADKQQNEISQDKIKATENESGMKTPKKSSKDRKKSLVDDSTDKAFENFNPFHSPSIFQRSTPTSFGKDSNFKHILNDDECLSSDPDMEFANDMVAPLKDIAQKLDSDKPKHKQSPAGGKKHAQESNQKRKSIRKNLPKSKMSKFRRIQRFVSTDTSDSSDYDAKMNEEQENEENKATTKQCAEKIELKASGENTSAQSSRPGPMQNLSQSVDDHSTMASILSDDTPASQIQLEVEELDHKIKDIEEKLKKRLQSQQKTKCKQTSSSKDPGKEKQQEDIFSDDSKDSVDLFTQSIPPTPPQDLLHSNDVSTNSMYKNS